MLTATLAVWWILLLNPLMEIMRVSAEVPLRLLPNSGGGIQAETGGDWTLKIPIAGVQKAAAERMLAAGQSGAVKPRFLRLRLPRSRFFPFTLALPLFWALVLTGRIGRQTWRALLAGTAMLLVLGLISSALYVADFVNGYVPLASGAAARFLHFGEYLGMSAVPYLGAIVIAIWLHDDLRNQIFAFGAAVISPDARPATAQRRDRRRHARKDSPRGDRKGLV